MVKTTEFNLQTQMNYVVGNMSGFTAAYTGMDNLSALVSSLMTSYTTLAGTGRAAYASIGAAIAAVGLKSAEAFGEFQRGMNIVKAIGNNTNAQMQILAQTANQFSSQFRMDISDINDGLTTLGRAGLTDVNNQIQVLQNGLQVAKLEGMNLAATLEDIVTTTSLLGGDVTRNDFGAQSSKVSNLLVATSLSGPLDVGDVIETLKFAGGSAAAAGANLNNEEGLKDLLGTIGAFSQKGVIGSIAGTALRAFITKPASQDKTVKDALAELGLDAYSLWEKDEKNGWQMRPIAEQIGLITDAMDKQHMTNLDRIEVWGDIVGNKMGQQMLKLDENKIKDVTKDIEHQRNLEDIYQGTLTNFASQMERLNQVFQSIYRNLGSGFATNLTSIVEGAANILEFINGLGNGVLFKIIATIIGPLGLAGLSKGLRDFGQILGALKDNIKKSASEDVWSQDLWSTQRGVIEKRMNKGETIIAQDEWSSFLKEDNKSSYQRETDEEYKARMDKREQDYQERQNKRDEEAQKRQAKKDEAYREQQAERNRLYKEQLTRLTQMSVGARFVQVEGSSIILDSTKLNIDFGETVAPMSNAVAEEIRRRENVSQELPQQKTVEKLSGASVNDIRAGANYLVPQKGKMDTSFSKVDKYAILVDEGGENSVLSGEAYNHIRGIEKEYRAGVGVMMEAQRKNALFNFTKEDLNTLHAADEIEDVAGRSFMTNYVREALIGMFKTSGVTNISGGRIESIFNEQLKSMVDNFTERGIYDDIFEMDEAGNIGVKEGQESLLAEKMSERVMSTIDQMYHNRIDLKSIYRKDFFDSAYYDENNETDPYRDFDAYLEERFKDNPNVNKKVIRDWKKMGYRAELLDFLNLGGVDMQGFNTYEAGLKANKNIPSQAVDAIIHNKLFSKLGFISQDTTLATDILTLMGDGMDGTSGVVADAIKAEVEDAKNAINSFDPDAEITSKWVKSIDVGAHKVVTQGLRRSSPGTAAQAFIDERDDIDDAVEDTRRVIERGYNLIQRATEEQVKHIENIITNAKMNLDPKNREMFSRIDKMSELDYLNRDNRWNWESLIDIEKDLPALTGIRETLTQDQALQQEKKLLPIIWQLKNRGTKYKAEQNRQLEKQLEPLERQNKKALAGLMGFNTSSTYGLAYATSPGEQKGLSILINKLKSNADMRDQFKTSKFKDLIEQWEEENLITTAEKGALGDISARARKQLFNPKTGAGLLTALENEMYGDIRVRRFQTDEEIDSVYDSYIGLGNKPDPRLKNNKFVVLDTETNTTTDRAEKQMIQYAILDAEKVNPDGTIPDDAIQSAIINSKNKIQEHAESISGISNELKNSKKAKKEAAFYDQFTRDLLKIINDGKAIVAHNTPFDKSVVLSNITRLAATGIYDEKEYQIGDKTGNIYDAIMALDKATWYDTLAEVKPYEYAKDVYGNDIFIDRKTGERSTKNIPVAEALTGKEYDRSLAHRADFDVEATYDTAKAIGDSEEGRLLYDTIYSRFEKEYERFMKNYKPLKERFYKSLGQFDTFQEFSAAEKAFYQVYTEEGLDKLDLSGNIEGDLAKNLNKHKESFIRKYNKMMVEYDEAMISSRITAGIKLLERVLDPESALVDSTPDLRSSPPISKTPGGGKHHTPGDGVVIEDRTALTEQEIMESVPKHYVPYEFKANYVSDKEAKQLIEFFNSDMYTRLTGFTKLYFSAFKKISDRSLLNGTKFESIAHLIDRIAYESILFPEGELDKTKILNNLADNQFGYINKIPEEMLENPSQRAIMEAIIGRVGLSNIMIGNQSVKSILNSGMFGGISQSDLLSLLSSGKIIVDNEDSLGYRTHKGEEFHPTRTYEQLTEEEKKFVDFFEEQFLRMFNYESLGSYSRKQLRRMARNESMGLLSDEYFEDNVPKTQEGVDNASPDLKYVPKKGNFNDIVMTLMQRPLKDLIQMLDNPDIIDYTEAQISSKGEYKEGQIHFKGADALASMISEKLTIYETIFNDKFEDGIFYYSSKVGGQEIGNGSYKTFEDIPMIKNLMQMYKDLTGNKYTLLPNTKSKRTAEAEMKKKLTLINNGEKALEKLNDMEEKGTINDPHNAELVQKLKDKVALGQQTQEVLSKKKRKDSFSPDVTRAPGYKDFSAVRKAEQFLLNREERVRQLDSYFYKQLGIDGFKLSLGEQSTKINKTVKGMGKNALDSLLSQNIPEGKEFSYDDFEAIEQEFRKQLAELPQFVQTMIEEIINKAPSFYEAMRILSSEGIKGFKIGAEINSPPKVISELIYYLRTLPQEVIASAPAFENAMHLYGQGVLGISSELIKSSSGVIKSFLDNSFFKDALKLSAQYNRSNITKDKYLNDIYQMMGLDPSRQLMSHKDFMSQIHDTFLAHEVGNIDKNQAQSRIQKIVAQYEDDNRIRGIRSRAAPEEIFRKAIPELNAQYKESTITMEEYIKKTMQLMGVEERRLMTEEDLTNKLLDLSRKLSEGTITEPEAEQESAVLHNQYIEDQRKRAERERKAEREANIAQGGAKGFAYNAYYKLQNAPSKIASFLGKASNVMMNLTMNPIVMLGEMVFGFVQQGIEFLRQQEQEKIAKLSEIASDADSAFEDQQSKWEEAQAKDNEDFNDLSDNEKQDAMLDAIAQGREDFNSASAETKALIGKQNELISANNNLISEKMDDTLTGYNGLQANYTELMEGSGMYGTKDEYGIMDFLESIINPDKLVDNSNTRRLDALSESSIQIDTRVKNMEEFTEDYQQVMASMGIAHRSILDIYNVRGIMKESELKDTFFNQSPSNAMRIGAPNLMSPEKLAGIMKQQEKVLQRFENRYLRFIKAGTGKDRHIEVTLGDGSIHKLAQQLGLKDIEAAQVLAVHQLQRIQDVMINQVEPQLAQQTLGIYNNTYQLGEANNKSDVQTMFQNTMSQGILAIQMQVAQLVYKAAMEQALQDYQAETGDTETNTVGLLLNKARDTTAENHEIAKKFSARGWGSYLQGRDINALVNQGYTEEQAIQKLAQQKGVSVDQLTNAYAQSSYNELGKYGYNGQERWLKNNLTWLIPAALAGTGAIVGSVAGPIGTVGGAELGGGLGSAALAMLGLSGGVTIGTAGTAALSGLVGAGIGAGLTGVGGAVYQGVTDGLTDFSDPFSEHTNEMMRSYANSIPLDSTIEALNDSQVAADEEGNNGSDTDDSDANKQRYVQLAICNKKAIPKLNVNLFKKAPTFTVLNKNFKLRDIKINTADKAKNIENSLKNAIIDVQERSDPKIIQDSEAEYDPVGATDDATNLPTGASLTK